MIVFENVAKRYQNHEYAVNGINLEIKQGEFFVIIGPSGCGKTTMLKMINRLIDLSEGAILINGKRISEYNIHELRWNIGYVLQQIALFPHMTIAENIAVVPEMKKWSKKQVKERVDELLEMVGLDPDTYRDRKPSELSGGQQQRVGVVRALAADPEIILMDEPFSALDPISRMKLQNDIVDLQKKIHKTIVFVTHDMQEALKLGDRILVMRDGQIEQLGTPYDIIHHPVNKFVRTFVGQENRKPIFNLLQIIAPLEGDTYPDSLVVESSATLQEVLGVLARHERVLVRHEDEIKGAVDRQMLISFLKDGAQESEVAYE
ncbi:MAG: ABC transporter ATP-binding protein [Bacillus sp. (in: firmicutes)]